MKPARFKPAASPAELGVARREWLLKTARLGTMGACSGLSAVSAAHASGAADGQSASPGALAAQAPSAVIASGRALQFPRDFGAHLDARTEWWYITGWLRVDAHSPAPTTTASTALPAFGFQITFFRSRTDLGPDNPSRFAARQLLFAHAAVSDLRHPQRAQLRHDQRIARQGFGVAQADEQDTRLRLRDWTLVRSGGTQGSANAAAAHSRYAVQARSEAAGFELALELTSTRPVLLQGEAGFSRKGPLLAQASHYYSQPQLAASGRVRVDAQWLTVSGRAWMDHEWSETLLAPDAVGWDWIGMNLFDGRALTAFQLRRRDGSALWAGGSLGRASDLVKLQAAAPPAAQATSFAAHEVRFAAGRRWRSPLSQADYPVEWVIDTPAGRYTVRASFDAQELDSRQSTGALYWEGLSELLDANGQVVGRGYLEMTGYAGRLQL